MRLSGRHSRTEVASDVRTQLRIAFVQRHYLPEVLTYCELTHGVATSLAADFEVEVITGSPFDPKIGDGPQSQSDEMIDGVRVTRLRYSQSFLPMFGFAAAAALALVRNRRRFDIVIVTSEPPIVLPWVVSVCTHRSTRMVQVLQDIHPEAGLAAGLLGNRTVVRILRAMDRRNARVATRTVVLSDDMASSYRRSRDVRSLHVINNYRLETKSASPPPGCIDSCSFNVTFAGNLGRFQDVDVLLDAAHFIPTGSGIAIHLVGSGTELERLKQRVLDEELEIVNIHGRLSRAEAQGFMEASDIGVITLHPGIHRFAYPSKTMAYLDAGCELLAIVDPASSLAADVREHGLGEIAPSNGADVAKAILASYDRRNHRRSAALPFGRRETLDQWRELVGNLL